MNGQQFGQSPTFCGHAPPAECAPFPKGVDPWKPSWKLTGVSVATSVATALFDVARFATICGCQCCAFGSICGEIVYKWEGRLALIRCGAGLCGERAVWKLRGNFRAYPRMTPVTATFTERSPQTTQHRPRVPYQVGKLPAPLDPCRAPHAVLQGVLRGGGLPVFTHRPR